jgi:two-component system response regulator YesN
MLRHFREDPSLASVAAVAGYTPNYFSARFKEEMGESFKQYLDRLRFDYAKKLLEHSSLTVSQVCRESGFDDYPNFVRRFSARFGCSPSKLRS